MSQACDRLAAKGSCRLKAIQPFRPAAHSGSIRHSIGILQRGNSILPRTVLYEPLPERLSASQQAVMRIRERKQREKGEGPPANLANPASDSNPVMVFIVRLLMAAAVTDNGIAFTNGASAQQDSITIASPIAFDLVWLNRKWDKNNR